MRRCFACGASATRTIDPLPQSRTTVDIATQFPQAATRRFGTLVERIGTTLAQSVVERAIYTSPGGEELWTAGNNVLATPLT